MALNFNGAFFCDMLSNFAIFLHVVRDLTHHKRYVNNSCLIKFCVFSDDC
jgi:hypothetical protein